MPQPESEPTSGTGRSDAATAWYVPIARAIPALAVAAAVTFTADHSAPLGLLLFGIFGVSAGAVVATAGWLSVDRGIARYITLVQGVLTVVAGVAALVLDDGGLPWFVFLLTSWAAITGFLELYLGMRERRAAVPSARDRMFAGALTAVLALAMLLVPPGFAQPFTGPDGVERALTASVIVVGSLGAYWIILGVYLVIAGLSLKWAPPATAAPAGDGA